MQITQNRLIIFASLFIVLFDNLSFFNNVFKTYPLNIENIGFIFSLGIVIYALTVIMLSMVSFKMTIKPMVIFALISSSLINYFMQSYNIVIDKTMIANIMQTDSAETLDLMSIKLFGYFFILGLVPSYLVYRTSLISRPLKTEFSARIKTLLLHLVLIAVVLFSFSKFYASFFREHRELRLYTNPITAIYNVVAFTYEQVWTIDKTVKPLGRDAKIEPHAKRKIIVMVVGEAARADHFSLNGYARETNPLLKQEDIINFPQMYSCGTSTAESVPCMFSYFGRSNYNTDKGLYTENVLDILTHAGVNIIWRDNNSNSKGVADRIDYISYKTPQTNTMCEGECRDEGMLVGLEKMIGQDNNDLLIVLHQMGNHGPAYYKRYPKSFEQYTPVCQTSQLETCSQESIQNAYDNAILYTDYFLSKVIALLKNYQENADTAMIYMADHGESLGEHGVYLHGLPYFMAPDEQKHIGAIMWFGKDFPIDKKILEKKAGNTYTHDNLFSTLLGLFNVQTEVYDKKLDILSQ
ncbi:MAG: phosphoethanolamine--lipid A transferase [Campylobacterales bacterium]|nr:phosphoethanolamine--lipid A transferase [Campylobacterales bacterium]